MLIWAYDIYSVVNMKWIPGLWPVSNGQVATTQEKMTATIGTPVQSAVGQRLNWSKDKVISSSSPDSSAKGSLKQMGKTLREKNLLWLFCHLFSLWINFFFQDCQSHTSHNLRNRETCCSVPPYQVSLPWQWVLPVICLSSWSKPGGRANCI